MRTILDYGDGLRSGDKWIPKSIGNRDYRQVLDDLRDGLAELIPTNIEPEPPPDPARVQAIQILRDYDAATATAAEVRAVLEALIRVVGRDLGSEA